jgi:hypothetical protein
MTPELQSVLDRLDAVERQARGWKLLVLVSIVLAASAVAAPIVVPGAFAPPRAGGAAAVDRGKFSVIEANRFVLRDANGRSAGGLEVSREGTIRMVLGRGFGTMGAAFMEVQPNGVVHLTLRGPDGNARAALLGASAPSLVLASVQGVPAVNLKARDDGSDARSIYGNAMARANDGHTRRIRCFRGPDRYRAAAGRCRLPASFPLRDRGAFRTVHDE